MSSTSPAYDEAYDAAGRRRPAYETLARHLGWDPLQPPAAVAERLGGRPLGDDARVMPTPLALDDRVFRSEIQRGIAQRAQALQLFFADVALGEGQILRGASALTESLLDEILASEDTSLSLLRRAWHGRDRDAVCFVYGADLAREPGGRWVVLEDNVGCVGGCADSYLVLQRYRGAAGLASEPACMPDLVTAVRRWLAALGLTPTDPGVFALFGEDGAGHFVVREGARRAKLVEPLGVRMLDDRGLDPRRTKAVLNLGVPSPAMASLLCEAFHRFHVPLLNAPGTAALGNKALLPFVNDMIRCYCQEDPILDTPATELLRDDRLPADADRWVVKSGAGCQGTGVFVLRSQTPDELTAIARDLRGSWPARAAIAQQHVEPSRLRAGGTELLVELRAIAYVLGWQDVFAGDQAVGKLAPRAKTQRLNNISSGASYAPVIRASVRSEESVAWRRSQSSHA